LFSLDLRFMRWSPGFSSVFSLDLFLAVGPSLFFFFAQVLLGITFSRWFGPEYWFAAHPISELRSCRLWFSPPKLGCCFERAIPRFSPPDLVSPFGQVSAQEDLTSVPLLLSDSALVSAFCPIAGLAPDSIFLQSRASLVCQQSSSRR
jgi:hypothetical protein